VNFNATGGMQFKIILISDNVDFDVFCSTFSGKLVIMDENNRRPRQGQEYNRARDRGDHNRGEAGNYRPIENFSSQRQNNRQFDGREVYL